MIEIDYVCGLYACCACACACACACVCVCVSGCVCVREGGGGGRAFAMICSHVWHTFFLTCAVRQVCGSCCSV